jgi:hypothetical protein
LDVGGNGLSVEAFVDLQSLLRGIDDDKAIGALGDVSFKVDLGGSIHIRVEVIVEFLKELFTGNQGNPPLSA